MQPMDFVPEEQHDSSQALRACICLASSIRHEGLGETFESVARSGQKSIAQGLPRVYPGLVPPPELALKGPPGTAKTVSGPLHRIADAS
jgi:hypothetical protein